MCYKWLVNSAFTLFSVFLLSHSLCAHHHFCLPVLLLIGVASEFLTHFPCPQLCHAPRTSLLAQILSEEILRAIVLWICCHRTIPQLSPQSHNYPSSSHFQALNTHENRGHDPSHLKKNNNPDLPFSGNLLKCIRNKRNVCHSTKGFS